MGRREIAATLQSARTVAMTCPAGTHPLDFPPNPHFSDLIGVSHSPDARLWSIGEPATPGTQKGPRPARRAHSTARSMP